MDTINIILTLEEELSGREIDEVERLIKNTGYCDIIRTYNNTGSLDIRLSYPRYFSKTNAFLIRTADECFEVQEDFVKILKRNPLTRNSTIRLVRADVPFTFFMNKNEKFHMFKNIFRIFAEVYTYQNLTANPKKILDMLNEKEETLIYSDRADIKNYYQKIMIYNQWKKFRDKYNPKEFKKICEEFPDLSRRIRIEYSIRVSKNRRLSKEMDLEQFECFNIYNEFVPKAIEYILENILNEEIIEQVLDDKMYELKEYFYNEKRNKRIDYKEFIYMYSDLIVDYCVIRKVLNHIENEKTREGGVTRVRCLIREFESKNEIIIMESYNIILDMIEFFKNLSLS